MDKTENKTAEEIVSKNDIDKGPPHWVTKKSAIKSCEEYAAQELAEYKAVIEGLLKPAEWQLKSTEDFLKAFNETVETDPEKFKKCKELKAIIDRARKLIDKL